MNINLKSIIIGFALMIFGGILLMTSSITKSNLPPLLSFLMFGYFIGLILIIIGVELSTVN